METGTPIAETLPVIPSPVSPSIETRATTDVERIVTVKAGESIYELCRQYYGLANATLMDIVKSTLKANPSNSIIAFKDNSSGIKGFDCWTIVPERPGKPAPFKKQKVHYHIIFTAETHNFPTGVAPFPGAETGTGGRIRDVQATGEGGLVVAGTAAYCVANLHIPGYDLPWEDKGAVYLSSLASPLTIEIRASDGASDYGNKFGEPVILGFTRSFDQRLQNGMF
jgi:phosphoribosylformylglycinamidine synthase